jgi:hypothetical protein
MVSPGHLKEEYLGRIPNLIHSAVTTTAADRPGVLLPLVVCETRLWYSSPHAYRHPYPHFD